MIDCIFVNGKEGVGHLLSQILGVVVILKYLNIDDGEGKGGNVCNIFVVNYNNKYVTDIAPSPSPNLVYKYLKIAD